MFIYHICPFASVKAAGESNKPRPREPLSIRDCPFTSVEQLLAENKPVVYNILINKAKAHLPVPTTAGQCKNGPRDDVIALSLSLCPRTMRCSGDSGDLIQCQ